MTPRVSSRVGESDHMFSLGAPGVSLKTRPIAPGCNSDTVLSGNRLQMASREVQLHLENDELEFN